MGYGIKTSLQSEPERDTTTVEPNQSVRLSLYWYIKEPIATDYMVRVRLLDPEGIVLWQKIEAPLRGAYPTSRWQAQSYVTDNHNIFIPPGTPPGDYEIEATLVDAQTKAPLPIHARVKIQVIRSKAPLADQIFIRTPLTHDWDNLRLIGLNFGGSSLHRGEPLNFSLVWLAREDLDAEYLLQFRFVDTTGKSWQTVELPVLQKLPTAEWQKNDAFRVYYALPIPSGAPTGITNVFIELVDLHTGQTIPSQNQTLQKLFTFSIEP